MYYPETSKFWERYECEKLLCSFQHSVLSNVIVLSNYYQFRVSYILVSKPKVVRDSLILVLSGFLL